MNDFHECLEFSHNAEDYPFWGECYRKAFPEMQAMLNHRQDGDHQRTGIDRSVIMRNSKVVTIDEKVRRRNKNGRIYTDIALERWSDVGKYKLGWVVKPLLCDYIAYAIAPLGVCYLLPVIQLQAAWREHEKEWMTSKRQIDAPNNGYLTRSYRVTAAELYPEMGKLLRVNFAPVDLQEKVS